MGIITDARWRAGRLEELAEALDWYRRCVGVHDNIGCCVAMAEVRNAARALQRHHQQNDPWSDE